MGENTFGSPIQVVPDANIIDLLNNILLDDYEDPVLPMHGREAIEAQAKPRPEVSFGRREGKVVGHYLWGAKLRMVGMLWDKYTVESLHFLRDYIHPPFQPWSTTQIGLELGMHRANVDRDLRTVCQKLGCRREDLRDRADRGLEREQKRLLKEEQVRRPTFASRYA